MTRTTKPIVVHPDPGTAFATPERCEILEAWHDDSDPAISIARASVAPGVTTQLHSLRAVDERYLIVQGVGSVELDGRLRSDVTAGDVVVIPAGTAQRITNTGASDLVFYCICTPPFTPECYVALGD